MSKGNSYLTALSELTPKDDPNDFFPVPTKPRGWKEGYVRPAPPPHLSLGWGWVVPCPPSLPTRGQGWGQGTALTRNKLLFSYVLSSMFPGLCIPNTTKFIAL
jgi:hypothetical protein